MTQRTIWIVGGVVLLIVSVWAFGGGRQSAEVAGGEYNPVLAGERLPDGFRQLLPRDAITPVYEPTFIAGVDIGWPTEAEVIGVTIGGESKAYPVSFLNSREMVVDELGGEPILVTW